ncbi:hypothetical protein [Bosea sp. 2RAB26]|uniref:hypothetical protein n=1 Tax=Bosea sp. 2RAB26 TaxID=3237476 RepID=UPI003F91095C
MMRQRREFILAFALLLIVFFAIRLPIFSLGWDGTDGSGHDTDIFVHGPPGPNYLLFGRVDGQSIYMPATGHPAPPYAFIGWLGQMAGAIVNIQAMSNGAIITMIKAMVSGFHLLLWVALLALVSRAPVGLVARIAGYAAVVGLAISPIAIQSTNEFQIDTFQGFLTAAAYAMAVLLVYAGQSKAYQPGNLLNVQNLVVVIAAALVALGKNEWALVLAIACICTLVALSLSPILWRVDANARTAGLTAVAATVIGLVAGSGLSILVDRELWMSGWGLLFGLIPKFHAFGSSQDSDALWRVTSLRLPFILCHLLLMAYIMLKILVALKRGSPALLLVFLFGFGLFAAFFLSTWGPYPRYFGPAFGVLAVTAVWLLVRENQRSLLDPVFGFALLGVLGWQGIELATGDNIRQHNQHGISEFRASSADCVPLIPLEGVYRSPNIDFAHFGWGYEGASAILSRYGRTVCK